MENCGAGWVECLLEEDHLDRQQFCGLVALCDTILSKGSRYIWERVLHKETESPAIQSSKTFYIFVLPHLHHS